MDKISSENDKSNKKLTKEIKEEENLDPEILKMQENLKNVYSKTYSLNQKLKELINNLQNEIKNNNNKKKEYSKKLL